MTVRNRILVLLLFVALVFIGGVMAIRKLDAEKFARLAAEREQNWKESVETFLAAQENPLATAASDLSTNIALAQAVLDLDRTRLEGALGDAELGSRDLQAVWVYSAGGEFLFGQAHSASPRALSLPPVPDGHMREIFSKKVSPQFYFRLPPKPGLEGDGLLVEVRGSRIVPAFAQADPSRTDGYLLVGRLLGPSGLAELPLLSSDDRVTLLPAGKAKPLEEASDFEMSHERVLPDWKGRPLARLIVSNSSTALRSIEASGDLLFRALIGAVLILFTLLFLLLHRSIVSPLQSIIRSLHHRDLASIEKLSTRHNELGELARLIGVFFKQRYELVDEMEKRVAAEKALRLSEEMLSHSQKMEAVGRLAGGVAHDFNNLLTAIIGFSDLLMQRHAAGTSTHQQAALIFQAGQQAADLSRQLLAFSRKQLLQPRVVDLNAIVENLHKLLRRIIGEDIEIYTELAACPGRIRADPGQIEQVIVNLSVNARDAMPRGGLLTIRTANVRLGAEECRADLPGGDYVRLEVSDTGEGMDAETKARMFEPFFTTKVVGKGTGLGLATVYGVVKQSRAGIEAESERGRGTTFRIFLPLENAPLDTSECDLSTVPAPKRYAKILLVEDDEFVRSLVCDVLTAQGHVVLAVEDGERAKEMARDQNGNIDLLVCDLVLPGLNGAMVAQGLRATYPRLEVLLISGYSESVIVEKEIEQLSFEVLPKPFTPGELAVKVSRMLGSARER